MVEIGVLGFGGGLRVVLATKLNFSWSARKVALRFCEQTRCLLIVLGCEIVSVS